VTVPLARAAARGHNPIVKPASGAFAMSAPLPSAALALVLSAGLASAALAAPVVAEIKVSVGPDLARKIDLVAPRDLDGLSSDLRHAVERKLRLRPGGGTLNLVIEDAKPNRPTPQQLSRKAGLSMESFGVGGARIGGDYVDPAGTRTPIAFSWYETDIRWARYGGTWHDAQTAFDKLADRLVKDQYGPAR
jgi:hypothetical protein